MWIYEPNIIGNNMGFSLVHQLQDILKQAKELKEKQKQTDEELKNLRQQSKRELWGSDFMIVHAVTLDDWAANHQPDFDASCNTLVHGGRLYADVETWLSLQEL